MKSCRWSAHVVVVLILLALGVLPGLVACGPKDVIPRSPHHPADPNAALGADAGAADHMGPEAAALAAAEQAAYERARPVFEKYCAKCHTSAGAKATKKKLGHFDMDTYPFGGHHAATIGATVREVLGVTGDEPTMPMDDPGVVQGEELEAIVAWSQAFDAAHAAGLHDHGGDHGGGDHGGGGDDHDEHGGHE